MAAFVPIEVRPGRFQWLNADQIVKIADQVKGGSLVFSIGEIETPSIHSADTTIQKIQTL